MLEFTDSPYADEIKHYAGFDGYEDFSFDSEEQSTESNTTPSVSTEAPLTTSSKEPPALTSSREQLNVTPTTTSGSAAGITNKTYKDITVSTS